MPIELPQWPGIASSKDSLRSSRGTRRQDEGEGTSDTLRRRGLQHAKLLADAEFLDDALVTLGIVLLQIVQQTTSLADQHKQAAPRPVVFLVRLEVLRQLTDALAQQRDLDLWATGIGSVRRITVNEGLFLLSG